MDTCRIHPVDGSTRAATRPAAIGVPRASGINDAGDCRPAPASDCRGGDMAIIETTGLHHVRITVTNLERSRAFYSEVLGFEVVAASSGSPDDAAVRNDPAQLYGGVVFQTNGLLFGLRPVADTEDRFVSERVGLDHISFTVRSRDALVQAASRLEERGIVHGEVRDLPAFGIAILSFSDPDGVHLELTAPL
jgi:catechol 2,3-dioxygenase-like lactoylglutathione lyase family enzyme